MGFDTINRERNEGTLSKLLSQPIYRDVVINGKFLAGVVMITVMMVSIVLVITGLGLIVCWGSFRALRKSGEFSSI